MKIYTQEEMLNKHIGKIGEPCRDAFEMELKIDLASDFIKAIRKKKHLTLDKLSQLIGFERSIVEKMEKKSTDIPPEILNKAYTILKLIYEKEYDTVLQSEAVFA